MKREGEEKEQVEAKGKTRGGRQKARRQLNNEREFNIKTQLENANKTGGLCLHNSSSAGAACALQRRRQGCCKGAAALLQSCCSVAENLLQRCCRGPAGLLQQRFAAVHLLLFSCFFLLSLVAIA